VDRALLDDLLADPYYPAARRQEPLAVNSTARRSSRA